MQNYSIFTNNARNYLYFLDFFVILFPNYDILSQYRNIATTMIYELLIILSIVNLFAFLLYAIDKLKAKRSWWRISEAALIWVAILGGSLGAWLAMKVFHHKTLHKKFKYGIPVILIIQLVLAGYLLFVYPASPIKSWSE